MDFSFLESGGFWAFVATWWVIWTQARDIDKLRKRLSDLER